MGIIYHIAAANLRLLSIFQFFKRKFKMHKRSTLRSSICLATMMLASATTGFAASQPVSVSPTSQSIEEETSITINDSVVMVSGRMSLGVVNGDANERVYNPATGGTLSDLNWELDNVMMLGAGVSVTPLHWLKLNADLWVKVSDGSGAMDDYDWFIEGWEWTHWSHHDDTVVDKGLMFDVNAEMTLLKHNQTTLYGIVGFKHDNWRWIASGGSFVYSVNGFRDTVGTFEDGVEGITYEQWFNTPYIGVGFQADLTPITLTGRIIGSTLVDAEDEDHHHMRNLLFEEDFESGDMISLDLAGTYQWTDQWAFTASFHFQNYSEMKGTTTITDQTTGQTFFIDGDAAGTDHRSSLFALSATYFF